MSFDFSYDKIAAGSNVSHSAQITEYAYDYIVKVYVSCKNVLWSIFTRKTTYSYNVQDYRFFYVNVEKNVKVN